VTTKGCDSSAVLMPVLTRSVLVLLIQYTIYEKAREQDPGVRICCKTPRLRLAESVVAASET
jgi:hypothetical protein